MKIRDYHEAKPNEEFPGVAMYEVITAAEGAPNFALRVAEVQPGASSPYHHHPWEHEAYIVSGEGVVKGEQSETPVKQGSTVFILPDEQHCFTNTGKETLRFI